jgi:hypothetical protein
LVVEVFHDLDGGSISNPDPIYADYSNLYFQSQDTDGDGSIDPYEIPIRQGSVVYFDVSSGGGYYHNGYTEDPNNPSFIPTGLDFDYIQVGNGDYIITVLSILG